MSGKCSYCRSQRRFVAEYRFVLPLVIITLVNSGVLIQPLTVFRNAIAFDDEPLTAPVQNNEAIMAMAVADSSLVAISRGGSVSHWSFSATRLAKRAPVFEGPCIDARISSRGNAIAFLKQNNSLWVSHSPYTHVARAETRTSSFVSSINISSRGRWVASGDADGRIEIQPTTPHGKSRVVPKRADTPLVYSLAFSHSNEVLAAAHSDSVITLTNIPLLKTFMQVKPVGDSGSLFVPRFATTMLFSPDDKVLASGHADLSVRLWSVSNGRLIHKLDGHGKGVVALAFSSNSSMLATIDGRGILRCWALKPLHQLFKRQFLKPRATEILFIEDDSRIAVGCHNGVMRMVHIDQPM